MLLLAMSVLLIKSSSFSESCEYSFPCIRLERFVCGDSASIDGSRRVTSHPKHTTFLLEGFDPALRVAEDIKLERGANIFNASYSAASIWEESSGLATDWVAYYLFLTITIRRIEIQSP